MDIQKAIRWVRQHAATDKCEASDAVLSALREQAEREKGCEYCNGNSLDNLVLTHDIAGSPRIALHGGNTPIDKSDKPVFCPKCGKRLK